MEVPKIKKQALKVGSKNESTPTLDALVKIADFRAEVRIFVPW